MTPAELTILFADVCNSTGVYDSLGDAAGRVAISRCVELMVASTQRHHGRVVKTLGDEVMAAFDTASDAAVAAGDIQGTLATTPIASGFGVAVRIGLHTGAVLVEDGDYFGDTVNLAARLTGQARPGEILTTAATIARLPEQLREQARLVDSKRVKGKRAPVDLYELVWEDENVTRLDPNRTVTQASDGRFLVLRLGERILRIGEDLPSVTLGRAPQNDLMVDTAVASRLHARIDYRSGHFVLTDQSTNGTWVGNADRSKPVRRDSCRLEGSGSIGLGEAPGPDNPHRLQFSVQRTDPPAAQP
jgi:class 3 adenylate cyclase